MENLDSFSPFNPSPRAILRVKNPIPAPHECPYCSGKIRIVTHLDLYGTTYSDWPWAYACSCCSAQVGMHPGTNIPLGTLADAPLRRARKRCKAPFEAIWRQGLMSRSEAYQALAGHLGIDLNACHFGWFDASQCDAAAAWARRVLSGDLQIPKTKPSNRKSVDSLRSWALNNGFRIRDMK